jgi:hypothetical protein
VSVGGSVDVRTGDREAFTVTFLLVRSEPSGFVKVRFTV